VDQKNSEPTAFENAFRTVLPAILQTISMQDPMIALEGADYSHFDRFEFPDHKPPAYLKKAYGIEVESGVDVGKIIQEDFQLVDSSVSPGVQVADLCASGLRRLLRRGFQDNKTAADLLGSIMLQAEHRDVPLKLVSLGREDTVEPQVAALMRRMAQASKDLVRSSHA
jgi:hypothetical protein